MGPAQVNRKQVALLEFVLKFCTREDTAIMARRWLTQFRQLFNYHKNCLTLLVLLRLCET